LPVCGWLLAAGDYLCEMKVRGTVLLVALYVLLAVASATQALLLKVERDPGDPPATKYNNYLIFKSSHHHLSDGKPLYEPYPWEHADLYKYSPTFALLFGFFAIFPDWLGLPLWNLLNVAAFVAAVLSLPWKENRSRNLLLLLAAIEAMTSLQNSQSNLLVAGLLVMGFALLEKGRPAWATLCIAATFYIKIFGVLAFILLLFFPGKRKAALWALAWMVLLLLLPLPFTGIGPLAGMYLDYLNLLRSDHSASLGFSVMGWLQTWFGAEPDKSLVTLAGLAALCLPLLRPALFREHEGRALFFSALLVWMVIFNHKAESPTFILAVAGVLLWYFTTPRTVLTTTLLALTVIFTILSPTDLFPLSWRANLFEPYVVKAVPCILAWMAMVAMMYRRWWISGQKITGRNR